MEEMNSRRWGGTSSPCFFSFDRLVFFPILSFCSKLSQSQVFLPILRFYSNLSQSRVFFPILSLLKTKYCSQQTFWAAYMINPKYAWLCQGSYKTMLHGTLRAFMFCERLDFLGLFWVWCKFHRASKGRNIRFLVTLGGSPGRLVGWMCPN